MISLGPSHRSTVSPVGVTRTTRLAGVPATTPGGSAPAGRTLATAGTVRADPV
jgi:hypothetical protein